MWSRELLLPGWKVQSVLQQGFPTEQTSCIDNNSDTACDVDRVYLCYSSSFNLPDGCTTQIKKIYIYLAQEQPSKDGKFHNCTYFQNLLFYQLCYNV
jgi:hypothetical protein